MLLTDIISNEIYRSLVTRENAEANYEMREMIILSIVP